VFADDERSPEKPVLKREEQIYLRSQIVLLPELQQEILRLRFTDGLRCKEIAARVQKKRAPSVACSRARSTACAIYNIIGGKSIGLITMSHLHLNS